MYLFERPQYITSLVVFFDSSLMISINVLLCLSNFVLVHGRIQLHVVFVRKHMSHGCNVASHTISSAEDLISSEEPTAYL